GARAAQTLLQKHVVQARLLQAYDELAQLRPVLADSAPLSCRDCCHALSLAGPVEDVDAVTDHLRRLDHFTESLADVLGDAKQLGLQRLVIAPRVDNQLLDKLQHAADRQQLRQGFDARDDQSGDALAVDIRNLSHCSILRSTQAMPPRPHW